MALINNQQGLIVVANSGMARLFARRSDEEPLQALFTIHSFAELRHVGHDKGSKPGHKRTDSRPGGVTLAPRADPQRKQHMSFAHQLAEQIDQAIASGTCSELTVLASNPFLGELLSSLSEQAHKRLVADADVDLTSFDLAELERRLDGLLSRHRRHMV